MEEEIKKYLKDNLRICADFEETPRHINGLSKLVITLSLKTEIISRSFVFVKTD